MSAALQLRNVDAGYGRTRVLHGVDLTVRAGQTVALLGANGAGKSTLLKTVAGMLRASAGEVTLADRRIEHLPDHARSSLGICLLPDVSQGIFRQLTVRENIAIFARGKQVREAIERAVDAFPILGERLGQEAGTMSGGQQQMLAVSRALVVDAPMILADELSIGLAPIVVNELFEVVRGFKATGRSMLLVDQYVAQALAIADFVYILHKGRIVFRGTPEDCRNQEIFEHYVGSVN